MFSVTGPGTTRIRCASGWPSATRLKRCAKYVNACDDGAAVAFTWTIAVSPSRLAIRSMPSAAHEDGSIRPQPCVLRYMPASSASCGPASLAAGHPAIVAEGGGPGGPLNRGSPRTAVRTASSMTALRRFARSTRAPLKSAAVRFASCRFALLRSASEKSARCRRQRLRFARLSEALTKAAAVASAASMSALSRSAYEKSAPIMLALTRHDRARLVPAKRAPSSAAPVRSHSSRSRPDRSASRKSAPGSSSRRHSPRCRAAVYSASASRA